MKTKSRNRRRSYAAAARPTHGLSERVEKVLELPVGSLTGAARIEMTSNRRAVVEGCQGIVEYADDVVRMQTGSGLIRFTGRSLSISCLTEDSAVVEGIILSLEFLS